MSIKNDGIIIGLHYQNDRRLGIEIKNNDELMPLFENQELCY
jgi:hypothetical protein